MSAMSLMPNDYRRYKLMANLENLTKSQIILIKNSLNMMRSYIKRTYLNNDEILSITWEYKEIDNILDKIEEVQTND
jgi:hypothetical protein